MTSKQALVAVRMAEESGQPELAGPLLDLVGDDASSPRVRQDAINAVMALDSGRATVTRLRTILASFAPPHDTTTAPSPAAQSPTDSARDRDVDGQGHQDDDASLVDDPSELVGTLLDLLWPDHLSFEEAAVHIDPVTKPYFLGMYRIAVHRFPYLVAERDLDHLLEFAETALRRHGVELDQLDPTAADRWADDSPVPTPQARKSGREALVDLQYFATAVADRILSVPAPPQRIARLARLVAWFLSGSTGLSVPAPLEVVNIDTGTEPAATRAIRHAFAEGVLRAAVARDPIRNRYWAHRLMAPGWRSSVAYDAEPPPGLRRERRVALLDATDATWAGGRADHAREGGDVALAEAWDFLVNWWTPSAAATPEPAATAVWDHAAAFAEEQRRRLDAAANGDTSAFRDMAIAMAVDPDTGKTDAIRSWDYAELPGAHLWSAEALRPRFQAAARRYLQAVTDEHRQWLGLTDGGAAIRGGMMALVALAYPQGDDTAPDKAPDVAAGSGVPRIGGRHGPAPSLPAPASPHPMTQFPAGCWRSWPSMHLTHCARRWSSTCGLG